jgi:hypothetical protein
MSKNTQLGNLVNGVYVDSTGKVGVGTQSPTNPLHISGAGTTLIKIQNTASGLDVGLHLINTSVTAFMGANANEAFIYTQSQHGIVFYTYLIPRMAITSAGSVGIGTNNPNQLLTLSSAAYPILGFNIGSTAHGYVGSLNATGIILNSQQALPIFFYTSDTERMRITSGGNVLIGTTSDNGNKLNVSGSIYSSSSIASSGGFYSDNGIVINYGYAYGLNSNNQVSGNGWYMQVSTSWSNNFRFFYGGTGVGQGSAKFQIDTGGGYTGISDINKKKDIALSTLGLAEVMQLKPSTFKFKDDENQEEQIGFIAQEVKDIIPQAYYEDKEGDDKFIGLKQAAFIPVLVKAIQELKAEIETLKNK